MLPGRGTAEEGELVYPQKACGVCHGRTGVWDFINRGMPLNAEGTLTADEVYALTAYLLYLNDLIAQDDVIDAQSLPNVQMPNRDGFAPLPDWQPGQPRVQGYPY